MGMFDEVYITCPVCGKKIYEQSKAYKCELTSYDLPSEDCPLSIVADLATEDINCEHCGARVVIEIEYKVTVKESEAKNG